jgi:quinol monooxygenase YgiN
MSISLLVAFAGTVLALAGTIALAIRCTRLPRADLIAWTCAMFGLAVSLAAQTAGFAVGFGSTTFRAVQLGAQVVATLGLALGIAEVAASSLPVRFAARLAVSALGIVGLVILATDPLGTTAFSKAFPAASVYYQPISNSLLMYVLAPFTALVALIAIVVTAGRSRRDPAWRATFPAVALAGFAALALAVPGLAALAGSSRAVSVSHAFPVLCLVAVVATWLAVSQVRRIRLDVVHQTARAGQEDDWESDRSWDGDETGAYDPLTDAGGGGRYAAAGDYGQYPGDPGHADDHGYEQAGYRQYAAGPGDSGFGPGAEYGAGDGYGADAGYPAEGGYGAEPAGGGYDGAGSPSGAVPGMAPGAGDYGETAPGGHPAGWPPSGGSDSGLAGPSGTLPPPPGMASLGMPSTPPGQPGLPAVEDHEAWSRLFGQIAIYTLLEDRVEAFDGLTEEVVDLVRTREPDTLVYIVHAVPSAPLQRILYEVYRDREAYEEHKRQPYIAKFEVDRRPFVLATNVIELGLQSAKVSPIPSAPDLASEPAGERAAGAAAEMPGGPLSAGAASGGAPPGRAGGPGGGPAGLGQRPQRLP